MDSNTFADMLLTFDASTCERHARKIVQMLGESSFEKYQHSMMDIVISNAQAGKHDEKRYFQQTENFFPGVFSDNDLLAKLAGLTLMSITLRVEKYNRKMGISK